MPQKYIKVVTGLLLGLAAVAAQAGGTTAVTSPPPVQVPTGGTITIPTTTTTTDLTGINWYCLRNPTIVIVVHIGGEKHEVPVPNPLCPR